MSISERNYEGTNEGTQRNVNWSNYSLIDPNKSRDRDCTTILDRATPLIKSFSDHVYRDSSRLEIQLQVVENGS